jgi:hypothetical protein
MKIDYPFGVKELAWHEAGHIAAAEFLGLEWTRAGIHVPSLSGYVAKTQVHEERYRNQPVAPSVVSMDAEGVIGTTPALRAISRRVATELYAGIAAERLLHRLPFTHLAFLDQDFQDFRFARYMLRLTDIDREWKACATQACDIVYLRRDRVAELAERLLDRGEITPDEVVA